MKVAFLVMVLVWANSPRHVATAGIGSLLLAISVLAARRKPQLPRPPFRLASLMLAMVLALTVNGSWQFGPAIAAVWGGLAVLATVVWLCAHPAVRRRVSAFAGGRETGAQDRRVATSEQ